MLRTRKNYKIKRQKNTLTVKELSYEMGVSEAIIRKVGKELIEKSLIKQHGIRPAFYFIDDEYFEN